MDRVISVIGGSSADPDLLDAAFRTGELLAQRGYTVLCGGGGGIMEKVCHGARSAGGKTVGILPGELRTQANRFIDLAIPTGMGSARNRIVALSGMVIVAIGGRYGTLSEIAFALDAGSPVCCIGGWTDIPGVVQVSSPEEALEFVERNVKAEADAEG
jgi:uncharacterized protein (TIGR00725 family)